MPWISILILIPLVTALVLAFRRFEAMPGRREPVGPNRVRAAIAAVGAACGIVGMLGFAVTGFRGTLTGYVGSIAGVPMTVWGATALLFAAAGLTSWAARA